MPVEYQDVSWILVAFCIWAVVDFGVVKFNAWRDSKKPAPRGAIAR